MNVCAPVLFLVFNRPEQTRRVFEAIRAAKPQRLYVAADGPRSGLLAEAQRCDEVRAIATAVDWSCEVHTLFSEQNLGCREAPAQAMSWFFEAEAMGIVLEDDCLPSPEFFPFATSLLEHFKDDWRVMKINGFNPLGAHYSGSSYFYSYFGYAWGWASWRRAWKYFSSDISGLADELSRLPSLPYPFFKGRLNIVSDLLAGLDAWDFQWELSISAQHGLQVIPQSSLIQNIGIGPDASHTLRLPLGVQNSGDFSAVLPLSHPGLMLPDASYERRLLKAGRPRLWRRIKQDIVRMLRHVLRP